MEGVEAFLEGEWESLSKLFSCDNSDLSMQLNAEYPLNFSNSFYDSSQDSSHSHSNIEIESSIFTPPHHFTNTFDDHSMHFPTIFHDDLVEEMLQLKSQMLCNDHMGNGPKEIDDSCKEMTLKNSRKRPNKELQRNKRNSQPKKAKKAIQNDEEVNNNAQSSSNSEEEGCNNSESTGKAKSNKSPATDPQSLYARKRRERINERLRILQNLVPNGTKVDISTMLEEAVHYVKFLQLQIKLLSSDETWMYAPIAYNGMDIGLYQKIVPNL